MYSYPFFTISVREIKKLEEYIENEFVTPEFIESDDGIGHWEVHGQTGYQSIPVLALKHPQITYFFFQDTFPQNDFMLFIDDHLEYYTSWQNYSTEHAGVDYRMNYAVHAVKNSINQPGTPGGYLLELYWEV